MGGIGAVLVDAEIGTDDASPGPCLARASAAERCSSRATNRSSPSLLKPRRLMMAPSSVSRNTRGRGLPACGRGVTPPASMKEKPRRMRPSSAVAFLSKPAARPSGCARSMPGKAHGQARRHVEGQPWHGANAGECEGMRALGRQQPEQARGDRQRRLRQPPETLAAGRSGSSGLVDHQAQALRRPLSQRRGQ